MRNPFNLLLRKSESFASPLRGLLGRKEWSQMTQMEQIGADERGKAGRMPVVREGWQTGMSDAPKRRCDELAHVQIRMDEFLLSTGGVARIARFFAGRRNGI